MSYSPDQEIIENYANVMVNFALNGGQGVRPGEVVYCIVPDWARPMYGPLQAAILRAGANPLMRYLATGFEREFFELASDKQIAYFPYHGNRGLVKDIDHRLVVLPLESPHGLEGVDPKKILANKKAVQPLRRWLNDKEAAGFLTWSLCFWGTEDYAREAGMTLEEYWAQIIAACYLDEPDPVEHWRMTFYEIERVRKLLNSMPIERIHVTAQGTDLWLTLGKHRAWRGGSGRNIPSFEIFVSPDYRFTHGCISFSQPLFYSGNKIEGIRLVFEKGNVVEAHAETNEAVLLEMIAQPNANHIGEFSLTDRRRSRITRMMCNPLFDENIGGRFGNTHIALGMSYKDTYDGDPATLSADEWEELGFNDPNCAVHTDIISTSDRQVEVTLEDGKTVTIYRNGRFVI